jgi:hypothetical protein
VHTLVAREKLSPRTFRGGAKKHTETKEEEEEEEEKKECEVVWWKQSKMGDARKRGVLLVLPMYAEQQAWDPIACPPGEGGGIVPGNEKHRTCLAPSTMGQGQGQGQGQG